MKTFINNDLMYSTIDVEYPNNRNRINSVKVQLYHRMPSGYSYYLLKTFTVKTEISLYHF